MFKALAPEFKYSFDPSAFTTLPYCPEHGGGQIPFGTQEYQAIMIRNMGTDPSGVRFGALPATHRHNDFILSGGETQVIEPTDPWFSHGGNTLSYFGGPLQVGFGNLTALVSAPAQ